MKIALLREVRSDIARAIKSYAAKGERRTNCARSEAKLTVVQYQHCVPPILTEALQNFHLDYGEAPSMKAIANGERW